MTAISNTYSYSSHLTALQLLRGGAVKNGGPDATAIKPAGTIFSEAAYSPDPADDEDDAGIYKPVAASLNFPAPAGMAIQGIPNQGYDADANWQPLPVQHEIRMGGVVVARIWSDGGMATANSFDISSLGYDTGEPADEVGLSGVALADKRFEKLTAFFKKISQGG